MKSIKAYAVIRDPKAVISAEILSLHLTHGEALGEALNQKEKGMIGAIQICRGTFIPHKLSKEI
jgi:hypothetical protein